MNKENPNQSGENKEKSSAEELNQEAEKKKKNSSDTVAETITKAKIETKETKSKVDFEKQNTKLQLEIKSLKEINLKLKDANLELLVEMENLRKRTEREIKKATNFASVNLIKQLLPFIDSLELGTLQKNATLENLQKGIQMSMDMLIKILEKNKVSFINPAVNSPLNPELHEAVTLLPNQEIKHNHILDVMQKGVLLNDRVIRSAKVIVADNPVSDTKES